MGNIVGIKNSNIWGTKFVDQKTNDRRNLSSTGGPNKIALSVGQGGGGVANLHEVLDPAQSDPALNQVEDLLRQHHERESQQIEERQGRESHRCRQLVAQSTIPGTIIFIQIRACLHSKLQKHNLIRFGT